MRWIFFQPLMSVYQSPVKFQTQKQSTSKLITFSIFSITSPTCIPIFQPPNLPGTCPWDFPEVVPLTTLPMQNFGDGFLSDSKRGEEATQKISGYPEGGHWGGIILKLLLSDFIYLFIVSFCWFPGVGIYNFRIFWTSTGVFFSVGFWRWSQAYHRLKKVLLCKVIVPWLDLLPSSNLFRIVSTKDVSSQTPT